MKKRYKLIIFIIIIITVAVWASYRFFFKQDTIHIALVGPMTGDNARVGRYFHQGVNLYLDRINLKGGIDGKKIVLDVFDDQNNSDKARDEAIKIKNENSAIAVIGHHYSSCSIAAGEIYKNYGIPAISPASTNVKVTKGNEWYFRSSFNDYLQGRFLVTYAKKVLGQNTISIICEDKPYGAYLCRVFQQTAKAINVEVKYKWDFEVDNEYLEQDLEQIVNELQYKEDAGAIFLATHAAEGGRLVRKMKDRLVRNPIMAPDAFASESFQNSFNKFPKEKSSPGYYTDGIYVTTPWTSDITNEKGMQFQEDYEAKYDEEPGWHAAFAYDTAMVVVEAIKNADIRGRRETIRADREKIRKYLANLTNMDKAVEGVTGYNYFDEQGDSQKPIFVATYKHQRLISALTQFQAIPNISEVPNLEKKKKEGLVVIFDGRHSYKINVVYTGIDIREISELDVDSFTYTLDFYLWFRYHGDIQVQEVEFLNALDPINLQEHEAQKEANYRLYHVKGKFRADFLPSLHSFGNHILGISFRPRSMDRNNLILVKDVLGMRLSNDKDLVEKMNRDNVLNSIGVQGSLGRVETTTSGGAEGRTILKEMKHGWKISEVLFFQDIAEKSLLGNPGFFNVRGGTLEYSRFNVGIRIVEDKLTLRQVVPEKYAVYPLLFSLIAMLLLAALVKDRMPKTKKGMKSGADDLKDVTPPGKIFGIFPVLTPYAKTVLIFQIIFTSLLLLSAESFVLHLLSEKLTMSRFEKIIMVFDILWWTTVAFFLTVMLKQFVYIPAEEKTGQPVPQIVRVLLTLIIYIMAFMGIVGFVFDQKLTSLLATGGVLAMIIGLAVQVNISNIFSGIAMNMERPFQIDDWVKIGEFTEGKVMDISWRTTRLRTRDDTVLCIPNSQASESPIENFSRNENKGYWKYFTIHVDPFHSPDRVRKVLLDAAMSSEGVVTDDPDHPPGTRFMGLTRGMTGQSESWAANYLIGVYVTDYGKKFAHNEAIWDNVWTHLKLSGIKHVMERQEIQMLFQGMKKTQAKLPKTLSLLQDMDIFSPFPEAERVYLSKRMRPLHYRKDQDVVILGDSGDSLFIISEGTVSVNVKIKGKFTEVTRFGAGDFFGEMALLTGEPRTATITAITNTHLYEITKKDIYPLLKKQPEILDALSIVLTQRKMANMEMDSKQEEEEKAKGIAQDFLNKINKFFKI